MTTPQARDYSLNYPPKNRTATGLGVTDIEVVYATGVHKFDPNTSTSGAHSGASGMGLCEPVPNLPSILSGQPAYLYRNDKLEVALTGDELVRLFMSNLRPEEYFKLVHHFGVFYEISSRVYDEDTGIATSPRYTFAEQEEHAERAKHPQLLVVRDTDGNWRPHSIMNFEAAEETRLNFVSRDSVIAQVVTMDNPKNAWLPDPFDNVVALYVGENDELRAYGRFATIDEARNYRPMRKAGERDLFDKVTPLYIGANDALREFGRFSNVEQADDSRPAGGAEQPTVKIIIASVNATYIE